MHLDTIQEEADLPLAPILGFRFVHGSTTNDDLNTLCLLACRHLNRTHISIHRCVAGCNCTAQKMIVMCLTSGSSQEMDLE